ncbi:MAG: ATP synthase F1 subunit epsilon [Candidatus Cloacimonadota bacterium]|nr:MAG: ATP synthase F1 subunit epsilon [Candidatus Cloacimonadota bacterium]
MEKIKLVVIQPQGTKIDNEFDHVIIPGIEGDLGVYVGHTPLITKIRPGILTVSDSENKVLYALHDGFVTVEPDKIKIVCETVEKYNEIDVNRAQASKERAEKRLSEGGEIDFRRAEASLKRALVRLETAR